MPVLSFVALLFLILASILYLSENLVKNKTISIIILSATFLKLLVVIFDNYIPFLPNKPDSMFYFEMAAKLYKAQGWQEIWDLYSLNQGPSSIGINLYVTISYLFFLIFGSYQFVMPFINVAVYSFMVIFVVRNAEKILYPLYYSTGLMKFVCLILMFYPAGFSISVYNLRDPLLTINLVFFFLLLIKNGDKSYRRPSLYISMSLVVLLRPIFLVLICVTVGIHFLIFSYEKRISSLFKIFGPLSIVAYVVFDFIDHLFDIDTVLYSIGAYAEGMVNPYPLEYNYSSLLDLLSHIPIKFFYFMYYPFPWEMESLDYIVPFFDSVLSMFLSILTIFALLKMFFSKGFRLPNRLRNVFWFSILTVCIGYIFLSVAEVQFTGAMRHRASFTLLWIFTLSLFYSFSFKAKRNLIKK